MAKKKSKRVPLPELKTMFFDWIDESLKKRIPKKVGVFNFCLYEEFSMDEDGYFSADLFGCEKYDEEDPDWACNWCFEGVSRFGFRSDDIEQDWESGLKVAQDFLREYLASDRPGAKTMRAVGIVTVGFSDGDIEVILNEKPSA